MSLRRRLTLSYISFFAVALIVLDIGLYLIVRQVLITTLDNELNLGAQLIQKSFSQSNKTYRAYVDGPELRLLLNRPPIDVQGIYIQIYQFDGTLGASSPALPEPLPLTEAQLASVEAGDELYDTRNTRWGSVREVIKPLTLNEQAIGVLHVARPYGDTGKALQLFGYALFGGGVVILLAAARGGMWLTRAAFKPIDEISRTAESIVRAEDLSRRVPLPVSQDELQRLTVTINDMLARMDTLFTTQHRFVADVSHELRTPLAAMRGNLDILNRGAARDPELLNESLGDMTREVNRLIRMVNDLLLLAQSDSGVLLRHEPVELDTLLLEVHRELRTLANGVVLQLGEEDQVTVLGDRDRIKQALLNLGINAIQHSKAGSVVTLSLGRTASEARLVVSDQGSGIAAAELPLIFNRFYRTDQSRNRSSGGAGLGLPIVKWIAEAHNGRIQVESAPGQGSRFTLFLPLPNNQLQVFHPDTPRSVPLSVAALPADSHVAPSDAASSRSEPHATPRL